MKRILSISFICVAMGLVAIAPAIANNKEKVVEVKAAQHTTNYDEYIYSGNYYDSITATGEGINGGLRKALSSYILPKAWPSYSGSSATSLAVLCQDADEDPNNPGNMIYLYTRDSVKKNAASSWNREHCWPQSRSGSCWGTGKGGSDLLHLRPTYNTANSTRGNDPYGEKGSGAKERSLNGMVYGWTTNGIFTPLDCTKGDVARIIMYMWVTYTEYYNHLPEITSAFESYDTMLRWHTEDRPDILEGRRNDFCEQSIQKNRNPFVDHPEYAWKIFGDKVSASVKNACMAAYPGDSAKLESISITSLPNKTTYYIDEKLDTTGAKVVASFDNGTTKDVTNSCTFSPMTFSSLGEKTITVSYAGKNTSFKVTVKDYEPVQLQSIHPTIEQIDSIYEGKTYQIKTTFNPNDVYPYPTLAYASNNTEVATVSSTGLITAIKAGSCVLTIAATQNMIHKTETINIVVKEKDIQRVADVYDMQKDDAVEFYCLYLGSYVEQNQGIFVGDGDYAVLIYGYTSSVSSFNPYHTYLKVKGTLDIFNNLPEVKNATITEVSEEIGKARVHPVTTYEFDGHESDDDRSDLSILSRPCIIEGVVKEVNGTFASNKDTTVTMTLDNGKDVSIFVKKNAGLDYSNLKDKLGTVGKTAISKGFISLYGTNYQMILPTIVEQSDSYTANDFAIEFLSLTGVICVNNGASSNKSALVDLWLTLELDKYSTLKDTERNALKSASADESGTDIEHAVARYDFIIYKYGLKNFMDRDIVYVNHSLHISMNSTLLLIPIFAIVGTGVLLSIGLSLIKKKDN